MVILKSSVSDRLGAPRTGALADLSDRRVQGCLNPSRSGGYGNAGVVTYRVLWTRAIVLRDCVTCFSDRFLGRLGSTIPQKDLRE